MYINELYHHGVKGQKWGVRRYQNKDGSLTNAGQKRYADGTMRFRDAKANLKSTRKEYNRSYNSAYNYSRTHPISQIVSKKAKAESDKRWNDTLDKANALREAKSEYAASKTAKNKTLIKEYNNKFNKASYASDIADAKWDEVKAEYKALGKNAVTRMINAAQNKTNAAKVYNKHYNEASEMSDKADALWRESRAAYKKTGRTYISRIFNNIKYGN